MASGQSAGTLYVDFEGRLAKLEAAAREAEKLVDRTRKRMDKISSGDIFGFSKGQQFALKALGTMHLIDRAMSSIRDGAERVGRILRDSTTDWYEKTMAVVNMIPVVGTALGAGQEIRRQIGGTAAADEAFALEQQQSQELSARLLKRRSIQDQIKHMAEDVAMTAKLAGVTDPAQRAMFEHERDVMKRDRTLRELDKQLTEGFVDQGQADKVYDQIADSLTKTLEREHKLRMRIIQENERTEMQARIDAENRMRLDRVRELEQISADMRIDAWSERLRTSERSIVDPSLLRLEYMERAAMQTFGFGSGGSFASSGLGGFSAKQPGFNIEQPVTEKQGDIQIRKLDEINRTLANLSIAAVAS